MMPTTFFLVSFAMSKDKQHSLPNINKYKPYNYDILRHCSPSSLGRSHLHPRSRTKRLRHRQRQQLPQSLTSTLTPPTSSSPLKPSNQKQTTSPQYNSHKNNNLKQSDMIPVFLVAAVKLIGAAASAYVAVKGVGSAAKEFGNAIKGNNTPKK